MGTGALDRTIPTHAGSAAILTITAMRKDLVGYLMRLEKIHGQVWRTPMGLGGAMISMLGPDALEFVLEESRWRILQRTRLAALYRQGFSRRHHGDGRR